MYYSTFNSHQNLNGFIIGINFIPTNFSKRTYQSDQAIAQNKHDILKREKAERTKLGVVYPNMIGINFIGGILREFHINYSHAYNSRHGFSFSAAYRYSLPFAWGGIYSLYNNPDLQLMGPSVYADWNTFVPTHRGYFSFGVRTGYRYLAKSRYWVGGEGYEEPSWLISRTRQDILLQERISQILYCRNQHCSYDWFINVGIRNSFYQTTFLGWYDNPRPSGQPGDYNFTWPKNGWYVRADVSLGFDFNFGW